MDIKPNLTVAVATNVRQHISSVNCKVKTETDLQNTATNDSTVKSDILNTMGSDEEIIIKQEVTELDINETLIKRECNDFPEHNYKLINIKYEVNNSMFIEKAQESYESDEKIPVAENTAHTGGPIVCNCKCTSESNPIIHLTTRTEENQCSCSFCGYKCTKKSDLLDHEKIHTREKPFGCNLCEFKTKKANKTRRIRKYCGEKPFKCKFCDYKCYQKGHLYQHMLTHTGQKPFSCTLCDYKCYMKPTLSRHLRTHTGEKPFRCSLCNYKCSRKSNLLGHEKTHTGEKPFKCTLCSYKCSWKTSLNRHLKTHSKPKPFRTKLLLESKAQISDEPLSAFKLEEVDIKEETF